MISRLRKIAEQQNNFIDEIRKEVIEDMQNENTSNMDLLNELDEADVRHERCPICKGSLVRKKGFKVCIKCGSVYKIMDGKCYSVRG